MKEKSYDIEVHYPQTEAAITKLRELTGKEYMGFMKNHIAALSISDDQKHELLAKLLKYIDGKN